MALLSEWWLAASILETYDASRSSTFTAELNRRPLKCLSWKFPYEVFFRDAAIDFTIQGVIMSITTATNGGYTICVNSGG